MEGILYCMLYCSLCFWVEWGQLCSEPYLLTVNDEDCFCLISKSNKCTQSHNYPSCLSVSALCCLSLNSPTCCIRPLRTPVLQDWRRLTAQFPSPQSSLGFHEGRQGCVRPRQHPGSPAVLMALGHRHEQENLGDLLSAAVTRCLQPASYQAQQSDKPLVPCCTPLRSQGAGGVGLKPATSNNSRTNLGIGELE